MNQKRNVFRQSGAGSDPVIERKNGQTELPAFLFETHAHTREVSRCGNVDAKTLVREHALAGYSGVVITDHYSDATFAGMEDRPHSDWVEHFLSGYRAAKAAAGPGFTVLLGMEIRFFENMNDYLVYGITEEFLLEHPDLLEMGIYRFSALAKERGMLIFQAHPFRNGMSVTDPRILTGIEVYNGNVRHDSRNEIAQRWAEKFDLKNTSGSDYHEIEDIARGGIYTQRPILNNGDLFLALLKDAALKRS